MRRVQSVASNPFAQVSFAAVAGYFLPKLFNAVMQSRASEPVSVAFAVICASTVAWRLWNRSPVSAAAPGTVQVDEAAAAAAAAVTADAGMQAESGSDDALTADQKAAAERIVAWMRKQRGIGTSPDAQPSGAAVTVDGGTGSDASPVVAALVNSGVLASETPRSVLQAAALEEKQEEERASAASPASSAR